MEKDHQKDKTIPVTQSPHPSSMKKICITILFAACAACTNLSDRKRELPVVSIIDLWEAQYVGKALSSDPRLAGRIEVTPYKDRTVVKFSTPRRPASEAETRKSMRLLKNDLSKKRGRTANTLIYIFPEVTLKE